MSPRVLLVATFLFVSGSCALAYQVAWLREFRLVFGGSTTATAAVLAVFMGGLGFGNLLLGRFADRHPAPLKLYAQLELAIALLCALSPWLIDGVRLVYVAMGGQSTLGVTVATLVRLAGTVVVLGAPTLLMGGTLPAAAKLVTGADDKQRRGLALVYGLNTLGAVVGTLASTFTLLPALGTRSTLWLACAVNLILAILAWRLAQRPFALAAPSARLDRKRNERNETTAVTSREVTPAAMPAVWVYATSLGMGCVFFLMEIVWYRMLAPLLGGTTYTFGIILAVALAGIGAGGALYTFLYRRRVPQPEHLALTCALQSLVIALPFALGDRFAIWSVAQIQAGGGGFQELVVAWTTIVFALVFPPSLISGLQFPLLLGLVGRGEEHVARQVGMTFACNTIGCILGSLLGGFGLLPALSAPGVWLLIIGLLAAISMGWLWPACQQGSRRWLVVPLAVSGAALVAFVAEGPTALWRHSSIGAGRSVFNLLNAEERAKAIDAGRSGYVALEPNELQLRKNHLRRFMRWEKDGVESSLAIRGDDSFALYVNGKSDGDARGDAATQIMLGIVPAALHPAPQTAFVIGLGTGETAGWLGAIPSIERVDCVELEPEVREMARRCASVNYNVLENPKVHLTINDARESLTSSHATYDLIISEPSNPYRAGVANLFTREFYRAARQRLNQGGIFGQWLQAYEVDAHTIGVVLYTLQQEFPHVELWQTKQNDLLLIAAQQPIAYNSERLSATLQQSPYREALRIAWHAQGVEGLLSAYVGGAQLIDELAKPAGEVINTDDHNSLEYAFARTVGSQNLSVSVAEMRNTAIQLHDHRPAISGAVDWQRVTDFYLLDLVADGIHLPFVAGLDKQQTSRWLAWNAYNRENYPDTIKHWDAQSSKPRTSTELATLAFAMINVGDPRAEALVQQLHDLEPIDADTLAALLAYRQQDFKLATKYLTRALAGLREDPWPVFTNFPCLQTMVLAKRHPKSAQQLYEAIDAPFALDLHERTRQDAALRLAQILGGAALIKQLEAFEPHVPWSATFLQARADAYAAAKHPRADLAQRQLEQYRAQSR